MSAAETTLAGDALPEDDDEALPADHDAYWDELTDDTLAHLRRIRADARAQQRRDTAFAVYVTVLMVGTYGGFYTIQVIQDGTFHAQVARPDIPWQAALPYAATAVCVLALLAVLRTARWRGPVLLDALTVDWLLPLPVRWDRLLRPKFRAAVAKGAVGGVLLGAFGGLSLCLAGLGPFPVDLLAGALAGGAFGVLTVSASAFVAVRGGRGSAWWTLLLSALAVLFVLQAVLAWYGHRSGPLENVALWSGPWGWAAHTLVLATGGNAVVSGVGWLLAAVLLVGSAVGCALWAGRQAPLISGEFLRERARTADGIAAAVGTADLRRLRLAARAGAGDTHVDRARWSPRPPRRRSLLIPWRDAVALTAAPAQAGWGLAWWTAAFAASSTAVAADTTAARLCALAATLVFGYLAAGRWVEPAWTEADDLRRSRLLPYPYPSLMLRHALLPTAALAGTAAVGCGVLALLGLPVMPGVAVLVSAPALVGAALVSANRGSMPQALFIGTDTMMGNTAPVQVLLWYVRAPLVICTALAPAVYYLSGGTAHPTALVVSAALVAAATAGALSWTWGRARRLYAQ